MLGVNESACKYCIGSPSPAHATAVAEAAATRAASEWARCRIETTCGFRKRANRRVGAQPAKSMKVKRGAIHCGVLC
ncbi:unnamed protein product [Lampetra planeri]